MARSLARLLRLSRSEPPGNPRWTRGCAGVSSRTMHARFLVFATFASLSAILPAPAAEDLWKTDLPAAKTTAAEKKQDLLLNFTGSDWCPPCMALEKQVFSTDEFKKTSENFSLVKLDFPRKKEQSAEVRAANQKLAEAYGITGYPTIILTDAEGRPYAFTGYREGGAAGYIAHLEELRSRKSVRDKAFSEAEKLSGPEQAKALAAALRTLALPPATVNTFYADVLGKIKTADPDDGSGYLKEMAAAGRMKEIQEKLQEYGAAEKHADALALVEKNLAEGGFEKEDTAQLTLIRIVILAEMERFDDALKAIGELRGKSTGEELARLDNYKKQIESLRDERKNPQPEKSAARDHDHDGHDHDHSHEEGTEKSAE